MNCKNCSLPVTSKWGKDFCCQSCSQSFNNRHRPSRLQGTCSICEAKCKKNHKTCSAACLKVLISRRPKKGFYKKTKDWRLRMKQALVDLKGGACLHCGYNKSLRALVFHHRDPTQKDFGLGGTGVGMARAIEEVQKCDLLCQNCHAEEHERLDASPRS